MPNLELIENLRDEPKVRVPDARDGVRPREISDAIDAEAIVD